MGKLVIAAAVLAGLGLAAWDASALTQTQINAKEATYQARLADISEDVCNAESEEEFFDGLDKFFQLTEERDAWYEDHNVGEWSSYFLECFGGEGLE